MTMAKETAAEKNIISRIEAKQGPVGKGHHNAKRTAALLAWLKANEHKTKGKK